MKSLNVSHSLSASALLLLLGSTAHAATLYVSCGARSAGGAFTSIGAALKVLQYSESRGPTTINVSGACHENVVIQSLDRVALIAAPGATITDASGGNADTVQIASSQSVSISNFTINGGASGVDCTLGSLCYLNGNTIQGASINAGVNAEALSRVFISGGTIQGNGFGINARNGAGVWAMGVLIQQNQQGVNLISQGLLQTNATITANAGTGVFATHNSTIHCTGCSVTGNGYLGIILRRNSTARFSGGPAVTGNTGGGVLLSEESSAYFASPASVTGNTGGLDVACGASATTAKFATTNIGGGSTNCLEPVDP
jgi:hypothetical protein